MKCVTIRDIYMGLQCNILTFRYQESGKQSEIFVLACDCKSPSCKWHVSCLNSGQSISSETCNTSQMYNRALPYHSLVGRPTMVTCHSARSGPGQSGYCTAKNSHSQSHSHVMDKARVKSNTNAAYQRGTQ